MQDNCCWAHGGPVRAMVDTTRHQVYGVFLSGHAAAAAALRHMRRAPDGLSLVHIC